MKFGEIDAREGTGAILGHSVRLGPARVLKKGRRLSEIDVATLENAGISRVWAARLDEDDRTEDEAANRIAAAIAGEHVAFGPATTGRANGAATTRGVLVLSREKLDDVNLVDEAVTVATLPPYTLVEPGTIVVTVKIIPLAVPASVVEKTYETALNAHPLVTVAALQPKRAGLILTTLPGTPSVQLVQASKAQRQRMAYLSGEIVREERVPHDVASVARVMAEMLDKDAGIELILALGASAIVDRNDVLPAAVVAAGGTVEHLGMPVDPGNLLMFARRGAVPIVGVPGCARSLKPSGFDWVLERLAANLPVTRAELMRMGAGGLLADIPSRPAPRAPSTSTRKPRVAAVILAAGLSRRMGGVNKLVAPVAGVPMVARVVDAFLASKAELVVVVVGHEAERVRAVLAGKDVHFVENPDYEEGLGASLRVGIGALDAALDGALIALGDMPWITASHVDALIDSFDPQGPKSICVPVHDRKRGHPVLWSARHFAEMQKLGGDVGARSLLERHADRVLDVPIDDAAVHLDIDTQEMLGTATT